MNNIEIKNIKGLEAGMTSTQINKLKLKIKVDENKSKEEVKKMVEDLKDKMKKKVIVDELLPYKLNLVKDTIDERDYKFKGDDFNLYESSNAIDWTSTMSPVKDQGRLGSCVAFATAAMKEWQEQQEQEREIKEGKRYRRKNKYYDYSEQWIYYNCKKIDPWPNSEGTSLRYAMRVLNKIGVPCEKGWKYNDRIKGKPESWAKMVSRWALIDSYYRIKNLNDLKLALQVGPVIAGIYCFREIFGVGRDGIVPYPSNPNEVFGGHAICIVGFNDSKNSVKFKNSWSTAWGRKGYGYLPYKYVNNFMLDAWAAKDMKVTKKDFNESMNNEL